MKQTRHKADPKSTAWQAERLNRLHPLFVRVLAAQQRGKSLRKSLEHFEWYWRDKTEAFFRIESHWKGVRQ
jgi:hypothetical protein